MNLTIQDLFLSLPRRFKAEKAGNFSGIFHFDITGAGGGQFTVSIANGSCTVAEGFSGRPDCTIKTAAQTHLDIEQGKANPQWAYLTGKVKVSNIAAMTQYIKLFRRYTPAAADATTQQPPANPQMQTRKPQGGPLQGIRILDLSRLLPGPLATMLLADWGAEVIKIEDPDAPDDTRNYPPFVGSQSAYYLALNRTKRSLLLNLRTQQGKNLFFDLLKTADVVIESFRPGVLQKIGIDYATAAALHPGIIYVSVSGYGQQGELAQAAGHDLNYIGYAGLLDLNGEAGGNPVIPGAQIADVAGGSYMAAIATLLALQNRQRTGRGDWVDVSMMRACLPLLSISFAGFFAGEGAPQRGQEVLSGGLPNYNVYCCADGKWLALGALEPKFWAGFCQMINRPQWVNAIVPGSTEAAAVKAELQQLMKTKTRQEWLELASGYDICLSPVQTLPEVAVEQQHLFKTTEHVVYGKSSAVNQPLQFTNTELPAGWAPPLPGEDTAAILKELGYTLTQIAEMKQQGIV
ncbi:carnitine dehydratase [Sphingobacteriales bacterium UPWRP_1]|nr:hypothetical protein B6N25_03540 [Sphingobacteriales bacterium TSM_CSS]PSJ76522.1 carnitine dehydratase [Sphingobacteriales bacterium UPWRP_1]